MVGPTPKLEVWQREIEGYQSNMAWATKQSSFDKRKTSYQNQINNAGFTGWKLVLWTSFGVFTAESGGL